MLDRESFINSPEIQSLVSILSARNSVTFDKRRYVRESVVCPVTIRFQYELNKHRAFSKDLSAGGICLIGTNAVEAEQIATLSICRLDDLSMEVRARCVWTKSFGEEYTMSGWKFLRKVLQNER